jgi:hypothetical protein
MKLAHFFSAPLVLIISCKTHSTSSRYYDDNDPKKIYHLRLNPQPGSEYSYTVIRSSEAEMEVDGKKVPSISRSTMDMTYSTGKDSAGNILLDIVFNKIHLYSKNGETEQEQDADKADASNDPIDKMLASLKGSTLHAVVNSAGQIKSIGGDEVIKDKMLASLNLTNSNAKAIASQQWDQQIKQGLIKKSMQQLFDIFPDSAVHVGNHWRLNYTQQDQLALATTASCQLKEIIDGTAVIESNGEITSDKSSGAMGGVSYTTDLKGTEQGTVAMELTSGMLLSSSGESEIKGSVSSMGRDIPVTISINTKILGKKVK